MEARSAAGMILDRCSMSATPEWEDGKWICIRGRESVSEGAHRSYWEIVFVPVNFLHQCFLRYKNQNHNNNDRMNHSMYHVFPLHLVLPSNTLMEHYKGLYESSWVGLGSTFYLFGGGKKKNEIYYAERNRDGTFSDSMSFMPAGYMVSSRKAPKVAELEGKVYIFSDNKEVFGEVFERNLGRRKGQCRPLSPPPLSSGHFDILFVVAVEQENKIVLGLKYVNVDVEATRDTVFFIYDVVRDSWVKHKIKFCFNLRSPLCQPIVVGSCLYWLDKKMRIYDLVSKQSFKGPIGECVFQHILETPEMDPCNLQVSLVHLGGDNFCIVWVDRHDPKVIHYTMIQARRTTTQIKGNRFELSATVLSCVSFTSNFTYSLRDRAIIV